MNSSPLPRYINEREVAQITGFALATLRNHRFLRKGIPYHKYGRKIMYLLVDVLQFMELHRVNFTDEDSPLRESR